MGDLTIYMSTRWGIDSARGNSRDVRMALMSSSMSSGTSCGRSSRILYEVPDLHVYPPGDVSSDWADPEGDYGALLGLNRLLHRHDMAHESAMGQPQSQDV